MTLAVALLIILLLIALNVPVAFSMIAGTAYFFIFTDSVTNDIVVQQMVSGVLSFPLLSIVFFVTAGILMNYTGITERLLHFARVLTGYMVGGLAKVNVLLSLLMSGLSGSNIADAAMQSKIIVPEMTKKRYPIGFSSALTASSALIAPIIPPGIGLIIYGYVSGTSIGDMFVAGILPGVLLAIMMLIVVHIISKKRHFEAEEQPSPSFKEVLSSSKYALLALLLPIIIVGGIRIGVFSPTEAGAIAILYAIILGVVYRELSFANLLLAMKESVQILATIMIIIAAGTAFGWMLTLEQIPQTLMNMMTSVIESPYLFLFLVMIFLIVIGMFLEGNVLLIILTPIFMPMLDVYGIDPVHFGIFFILCLAIGTITPPIGTVMFAVISITKAKINQFIKEVLPFWGVLITVILLIAYIPAFSLWLPELFS
ncbi:TRAP transporter large permease [Salicibibacter cibi]|uniref:TRAP transporter large permease n=1 Tax=Salicibibacter cibi TaxID=2743001 RepID=A0A7T6Z8E9_9BACI|nr:TRAP transporter large permease [Salicibibacter cibi]QQK78855.1 TRAP transporter large permease [Salicibibacter cibi]